MNAMGVKVGARYSRLLPAFTEPIELGIVVPMDDYKFLRAYKLFTLNGDTVEGQTAIGFNQIEDEDPMGNEISKNYILDLDGDYIRNALIGPSTYTGSKGISQLRAGKQNGASAVQFDIDKGVAETLRMNATDNDPVIVARQPQDWNERDDCVPINTNCTVRTPQMIGISKHANSLFYNFDSDFYLELPLTDAASIDPNFAYRFSFYYRASGTFDLIARIMYYTNSGALIDTEVYSTNSFSLSDTETSDFRLFQIGIPRITFGSTIPAETNRLKVVLKFETVSSVKFELAYPVLEHAVGISAISGYIFIPDPPSDIEIGEIDSAVLGLSPVRTNVPTNSASIFYSHIGRKLFNIGLDFSIMDSTYVSQLRVLDQMSKMGYKIALRPKHSELPPVLVGDIKVNNRNPTYDYNVNNISLAFEEVS